MSVFEDGLNQSQEKTIKLSVILQLLTLKEGHLNTLINATRNVEDWKQWKIYTEQKKLLELLIKEINTLGEYLK